MHELAIHPDLQKRLVGARRGRPTLFGALDPARTAHVVVDLQNGFMLPGATVEVPVAREIVPNVNAISRAVRAAGAINIFLQYLIDDEVGANWPIWLEDFADSARADLMRATFAHGSRGWQLYDRLDIQDADLRIEKRRFGAFVPGTCDLETVLADHDIDTLIVTGTCTNVCCESTAREAMQRNYKVIFVSDATAAFSDAEHNAALNSLGMLFADVMPTAELLAALAPD